MRSESLYCKCADYGTASVQRVIEVQPCTCPFFFFFPYFLWVGGAFLFGEMFTLDLCMGEFGLPNTAHTQSNLLYFCTRSLVIIEKSILSIVYIFKLAKVSFQIDC